MRVLFVGGGTLGSVTPLLAVAEELGSKCQMSDVRCQMLFWGTKHGPERQLVEAAGIPFRSIPAGKLRRYWDVRNIVDVAIVKWAFWVALVRLIRWRPSVVVGAGSFVQVPVMWAAALLRIPIIIHQLDVRPSLANHLVAPFARHITAVFPASASAFGSHLVAVIGNPVRRAILAARTMDSNAAKRHFGFSGDRPTILVIGGGTGAQALNEFVRGALPDLTAHVDVIHVTGKGKEEVGKQKNSPPPTGRGSERGWGAHYTQFPLLTENLPSAYAAADLVMSRAGMGTITELAVLGRPLVLIPMPDTHQEDNAVAMERIGAAVVWNQRDLTSKTFIDRLFALVRDRALLGELGHAGAARSPSDASGKMAAMILRIEDPSRSIQA